MHGDGSRAPNRLCEGHPSAGNGGGISRLGTGGQSGILCVAAQERTPGRAYTRPLKGMAASDPHPPSQPAPQSPEQTLSAQALERRLIEEIKRAERHGTPLSALLVVIDNLGEMAREHGSELREQTLSYIAAAVEPELRGFDRVGRPSDRELLIVLPGADGPRGEMVARRVLDRVSTIKIEAEGTRRVLRCSVGLADWRGEDGPEDLLNRTRLAARGESAEEYSAVTASPPPVGREPK